MQPQSQHQNGQPEPPPQQQYHQQPQSGEFLEQILSTFPNCSRPPNPHELPSPLSPNTPNPNATLKPGKTPSDAFNYSFNESNLVSKLSQQQLNEVLTAKSLLLQHQQQFLLSRRPHSDPSALFNGFGGSLDASAHLPNQTHFHPPPPPPPPPPPQGGSMGGRQGGGMSEGAPPASASTGGSNGGGGAPPTQRVRARRGQATDPHSIAERLRRERIAERMKALQELVPNANKTDKASMLDEIIDYVKFLQLQVKVLSMSRLGGASAVAPLVADMNFEGGLGRSTNGAPKPSTNDNTITVTEHQVAKLMEEDMGSAMQYLQGKGLCLMPISLATAISTATSMSRTPLPPPRLHLNNGGNHHHNDNRHSLLPTLPSSNGEVENNANYS